MIMDDILPAGVTLLVLRNRLALAESDELENLLEQSSAANVPPPAMYIHNCNCVLAGTTAVV